MSKISRLTCLFCLFAFATGISAAVQDSSSELADITQLYENVRGVIISYSGRASFTPKNDTVVDQINPPLSFAAPGERPLWAVPLDEQNSHFWEESFAFDGEKRFWHERSGSSEGNLLRNDPMAWDGVLFTAYAPIVGRAIIDDAVNPKGVHYTDLNAFVGIRPYATALDAAMLAAQRYSCSAVYSDLVYLLKQPDANVVARDASGITVEVPTRHTQIIFDKSRGFAVKKLEVFGTNNEPFYSIENLEFETEPTEFGFYLPNHSLESYYIGSPAPREYWGKPAHSIDMRFTETRINPELPNSAFSITNYPLNTLIDDRLLGKSYSNRDKDGLEKGLEDRLLEAKSPIATNQMGSNELGKINLPRNDALLKRSPITLILLLFVCFASLVIAVFVLRKSRMRR